MESGAETESSRASTASEALAQAKLPLTQWSPQTGALRQSRLGCVAGVDDDWTLFFLGLSTPGASGKAASQAERARLTSALERVALGPHTVATAESDGSLTNAVAQYVNGGRWLITKRGATEADPRLLELIHSARSMLAVRRAQSRALWTEALALARVAMAQQPSCVGRSARARGGAPPLPATYGGAATALSSASTFAAVDGDADFDFAMDLDPESVDELACAATHARRVLIEKLLGDALARGAATTLPLDVTRCQTAELASALARADAHVSARALEVGGAVRFGWSMRRLRMVAIAGRLVLRLRTALHRSDWSGVVDAMREYALLPTQFGGDDAALAAEAAPTIAAEMRIAEAHVVLLRSMAPLRDAIAAALRLSPLVGDGERASSGALQQRALAPFARGELLVDATPAAGAEWSAASERERAAALRARAGEVERAARVHLRVRKGRARASAALQHATNVATAALRVLSPAVLDNIARTMPEQSQLIAIGTAVSVLHSALLEVAESQSQSQSQPQSARRVETGGVRSAIDTVCGLVLRASPFAAALRAWQRIGAITDFELAQLWLEEQRAIRLVGDAAVDAQQSLARAARLRSDADAAQRAALLEERELRHELVALLDEERTAEANPPMLAKVPMLKSPRETSARRGTYVAPSLSPFRRACARRSRVHCN